MGKTKTPTTTTTTPTDFNAVLKEIQGMNSAGGTLLGTLGAGSTGSTTMPGVPATQAGDVVTWQSATQKPSISLPANLQSLLTKDSSGNTQITYNAAVDLLHQAAGDRSLLIEIQNDLKNAGFITPTQKVQYGTLDKVTLNAWKTLITNAVGTNTPITETLATNAAYQKYLPELTAMQAKAQTSLDAAASAQAPMLTLTDENHVAQAYATAMESMGMGAPSAKQVAQFVSAFHNAEVGAVTDAYTTQKNDYNNSYNALENKITTLQGGPPQAPQPTMPQPGGYGFGVVAPPGTISPGAEANYNQQANQFSSELNSTGPVTVAQKAMPNLNAEAIAAAKATDPGMYFANQTSYLYGMIQDLLAGNEQVPTTASSPTSQAPMGAIVTTPLAGTL